ncbi:FecR family protein [Dyadobacter sp. CY323]|uniref:FecR family protein n=1 Tax=Dyadobacter sp. CY323 TaxID=2907302 RepID=UPI001F3B6062|nr:FecR domain-containing protein [Dyadobacter sp. CY323]MCE6991077.1 FecR domain-containing protein [Dyadobacter sp. CY323]
MKPTISKRLIFDHFANKTSPLQKTAIESWLTDRENEELYYQWLEEWERNHLQYDAPSEIALENFFSIIEQEDAALPEEQTSLREKLASWTNHHAGKIAAVIALALGLAWYNRDTITYVSYKTGYGEIETFQLKDGSKVKLNANSVLTLSRWNFGETKREVFLKGDASFDVEHLKNHQKFIVNTPENFTVEVLGTEFTMSARKFGSKVILTNGKVKLHYREATDEKELIMKPGDVVKLKKDRPMEMSRTEAPETYSEWENKRFVFDETTLEEMGYQLHETYGLDVTFSSQTIASRQLMGSFKGRTIDEFLQSIAEVLDLSVSRENNKVLFTDH